MKTHFNLIQVDVYYFFTIRANFGHLSIEVDRISATRTACNDNADDLCFLLHVKRSFLIRSKLMDFEEFPGNCVPLI